MKTQLKVRKFSFLGGAKTALLTFALISLGACLEDKEKCSEPYSKVITAVKINGGKNVYFNLDDFDFMLNSNIVIDEISLEGEMEDNKDNVEDFSFDINGIKAVRKDGGNHIELDRSHGCHYKTPVHKFFLNGGEPFSVFMAKLKLQKGQLILNMHAPKNKVIDARLVISGKKYVKCDTPPPPPPPPASAPNTNIDSVNPVGNVVKSANMTINFSSDQAGVTFWCSIDGAAASTCTSPLSISGLANGNHNFSVYAANSAGLSDTSPATYSWAVDTLPPSVTIDNIASLKAITNQTSITFLFSSNEVGTFTCSLDGGVAASCSSPSTFSGLGEGNHSIAINVVDGAGNASENPATFNWAVDLTAPVASIINVSPSAAVNNSANVSFEFNANESSTFECSVDNGSYNSCSSPLAISGVAEGSHWFAVRAIDVAGNVGNSATYNWTTDLTAPVITITNSVPAQGLTNANNVFVEFSSSENASITCSFDGAAAACTSPFSSAAGEGNHQLIISSTDLAGNNSAEVSLSWTMDFTNPILSWGAISPSPSAYISSQNISLEVVPSEVVTFVTTLNGVDVNQGVSPVTFSGLAEGTYTVEVTALDSAGNPSAAISHTFTVDVSVPVISVASVASGLVNVDNNSITFSANESVNFACNVDSMGFAACSSPLLLSGLADGNHNVDIKATDLAGNVSPVSSVSWSIDTVAPNTSLSSEQVSRNRFNFSFTSNDAAASFMCSLDGAAYAACASPVSYTLSDGAHTFAARALDAAGNLDPVGASVNVTALPPIATSIISALSGLTNNPLQNVSFTSNYASATYMCSLDGAVASACTSPKFFSVGDGAHTFKVFGIDPWGEADAAGAIVNWTVDTIAPSTSLTVNQNSNNNFTFTMTSNEGNSTFLCSFDGGSYQSCSSPLNYTASEGEHTIAVRAVDPAGNVDQEGASAPYVVYPPLSTIITGASAMNLTKFSTQSISFTSSVTGATFECSLDGAAYSACTSPVNYTGLADGAHTFNVRAIAPWGQVDNVGASVSWTIDTVAPVVLTTSFTTTSTTATINWTTNEQATSGMLWGITPNTNNTVADDGVYKTTHQIKLVGLSPNTSYSVRPTGHDQAGNTYTAGPFTVRTGR
jgi:large repetitive protein